MTEKKKEWSVPDHYKLMPSQIIVRSDNRPWVRCWERFGGDVEYVRLDLALDNIALLKRARDNLDQLLDDMSQGKMEFPGHGVCEQAWDEAQQTITAIDKLL